MADIPPPPPGSPPGPPQYAPPPGPPQYAPPPVQPPAQPSYSDIPPAPPGAPGYMAPGGYQNLAPGVAVISQFSGMALWSIILGLLSVGVPIVTGLTSGGSVVYFYVLPIFGLIRGVQAITRGQVIGGIIGIALNVIGGIISLTVAFVH